MVFKVQILLKLWTSKNTVFQKLLIIFHIRLLPKQSYIKLNLIVSQSCSLLVPDLTQPCRNCKSLNVRVMSQINRKKANLEAPAKLKAPIKFTSSEKIKLTLQQHRK